MQRKKFLKKWSTVLRRQEYPTGESSVRKAADGTEIKDLVGTS